MTRTDSLNPFECKGNYSATSDNMKLVHWPSVDGLLHLVQRGGDWAPQRGRSPPRLLLDVPNATACYSQPINGQFTNYRIMVRCSAVLMCPLRVKITRPCNDARCRSNNIHYNKRDGHGIYCTVVSLLQWNLVCDILMTFSKYGIRSLRSSVFDIKQTIWLNFVKNVQM